jgi:zinc protease
MRVTPYPDLAAGQDVAGFNRATEPVLGAEAELKLPPLQRTKLSNGLEVVVAESHRIPVVQLNMVVRGGWSADSKEKFGTASFMARMQDEGTKKRSTLQISDEALRLGANLNTSSSLDNLHRERPRRPPRCSRRSTCGPTCCSCSFPAKSSSASEQSSGRSIRTEAAGADGAAHPPRLYGENHYGQPLTGTGNEPNVKAIARRPGRLSLHLVSSQTTRRSSCRRHAGRDQAHARVARRLGTGCRRSDPGPAAASQDDGP